MPAPTTLPGRAYVNAHTAKISRLLFHYRARGLNLDAISGQAATFSRASAGGAVHDRNGVLRTPVHSQPRFEMVDLDGDGVRETPGLLLEIGSTNQIQYSSDYSQAYWTKAACSVTGSAATGPDGIASSAQKLVEDNTNGAHYISRPLAGVTISDSKSQSFSQFFKAAERSWVRLRSVDKAGVNRDTWFNLGTGGLGTIANGHTAKISPAGYGFYRCSIVFDSGTGAGVPQVQVILATGDGNTQYQGDGASGLYAYGAQFEADQASPTSYVATSGSAVARSADSVSYPFLPGVAAMTVYTRLIERGSRQASNFGRVFAIGQSSGQPTLSVYGSGANYTLNHNNGSSSVSAFAPGASAYGDIVELRGVLNADGSVQLGCAINNGSEQLSAVSSALVLASSWGASSALRLNSAPNGGNPGESVFLDVKVAAGVQSLDVMREAF